MPRISIVDRPAPACDENDTLGTLRVRSVRSVMWFSCSVSPLSTDTLSGTLQTSSRRFCEVTTTCSSTTACGADAADSAGAGACCAWAPDATMQARPDSTAGAKWDFDM